MWLNDPKHKMEVIEETLQAFKDIPIKLANRIGYLI